MPPKRPSRRTRNLYNPDSKAPYRLSRSRLENFLNCPRCFYLDRRLGVEPPGIPAFTLNSAVDELLKKEFDRYRRQQKPHPLMKEHNIQAVPLAHPMMDEWRETFKGVRYHHSTNLIIFGAIDDLWVDGQGRIYVVDFKATSTKGPITLDNEYRQAYKRQMEIYQWLLRKQDLKVSSTGYFVYCNGDKEKESFDAKLEFLIDILPYEGNDDWVEDVVLSAHKCLNSSTLPGPSADCPYCNYRVAVQEVENGPPAGIEVQKELF